MRARVARWLSIPEELVEPTLLLATAAFFFIAGQSMLKAARDGVFLTRFGLVELAYAMLGMALLAAVVTSAYHRWTGSISRRTAFVALQLGVVGSLLAIGEGLHRGVPGMPAVLYMWSGVTGLVALAELWLLADELFSAYAAKRTFAIIGAGAIIGGICGGLGTRLLATHVSARGLLWIVAGELTVAAIFMHIVMVKRPRAMPRAPRGFADGLRTFRESGYVRTLAAITLCLTVATTTVEWQLKGIAKAHYGSDQGQMTALFGLLGAVISLVALLLQVFGTERILRRWGAIPTLRGAPISIGTVAVAVLFSAMMPVGAVVLCGIGVVVADSMRLSFDKAASELLYAPLDARLRAAAKRLVDTTIDRLGGALTAALWLVLAAVWHVDRPDRLPYASVLTLAAVVGWLWAISRMRTHYVEAHRRLIGLAHPPSGPDPHAREKVLALLEGIEQDVRVRTRLLRRINLLQSGAPIAVDWEMVEPHIAREARHASDLAQVLGSGLLRPEAPGHSLAGFVELCLAGSLERVARLLALVYPPRDLVALHRALRGTSERVRSAAVELLDSMMRGPGRQELLRVIAERFGVIAITDQPIAEAEALAILKNSEDPRLRTRAAHLAHDVGEVALEPNSENSVSSGSAVSI